MVSLRAWVILSLFATLAAAAVHASTPAEYSELVQRTARELESIRLAEQSKRGSGQKDLQRLSQTLPASMQVETGSKRVRADVSWIRNDLRNVQKLSGKRRLDKLNELTERVDGLAAASDVSTGTNAASAARSKTLLSDVLSGGEFRVSPMASLGRRIRYAISELIGRLFSSIPQGAMSFIYWLVVVLVVVAFAVGLVFLVMKLLSVYYPETREKPAVERRKVTTPSERSLQSLLADAERHASQARYRDALRCIYVAAIFLLDRAHAVAYTESGTNWEYIRALRQQSTPQAVETFRHMTNLFDESVYGKRNISKEEYLDSVRDYERLEGVL